MKELLERLLDEAEGAPSSADELSGGEGPSPNQPQNPSPSGGSFTPNGGQENGEAGGLGMSAASLFQTLGALGPLLGGGGGSNKRSGGVPDRHTALLCALKPYLRHERREAVDTLLQLCRVWDVLSKSGISMGGILNSLNTIGGRMGGDTAHREASDPQSGNDPRNGSGR